MIRSQNILSSCFYDAQHGRRETEVVESLRSDAWRFANEVNAVRPPATPAISADTLLQEAWSSAKASAKSAGRLPRCAEVQAHLYTLKDRCASGLTL